MVKRLKFDDGEIYFLTLSDGSLWYFRNGFVDWYDPHGLDRYLDDVGDNIHVIRISAGGVRPILQLKRMLKYKTLSWIRPDLSKMVCFTRR